MKRQLFSVLLLLVMAIPAKSQEVPSHSFSIFTGGMILKSSHLSTTKLGYETGHFGINADFTYDDYRETWQDESSSVFQLRGLSVSGRYYLRPLGRSIFGEVSTGYSQAVLTTTGSGQERRQAVNLPMAGYGLGWRFGRKPKGLFGEAGLRMTYVLKDAHLYTTDEAPATAGPDNISYQSWVFNKSKANGQLYVGIGYSF